MQKGNGIMFCSRCGCEVKEGAAFCANCGAPQRNAAGNDSNYDRGANSQHARKAQYNVLSIVGMELSCIALIIFNCYGLVGLAGMIVSIIGLKNCKKNDEDGRAFAIIGIVVGGIAILAGIISLIVLCGILNGSFFDGYFDAIYRAVDRMDSII